MLVGPAIPLSLPGSDGHSVYISQLARPARTLDPLQRKEERYQSLGSEIGEAEIQYQRRFRSLPRKRQVLPVLRGFLRRSHI